LLLRIHELVEIFFRNASSVTIQARNIFECRRILSSILVKLGLSDAFIAIRVHGCECTIDHELVYIFFRNASSVTIQARNIFECRIFI
jgi:hypothetical protein